MLYAVAHRARRRLLRLLLIVSTACLAEVLASPTTAYDSYGTNHAASLVRQAVVTASAQQYRQLSHHHHLHYRNALSPPSSIAVQRDEPQLPPHQYAVAALETLPVQQHLLANEAAGVTRVPWYGLTELSDVLLVAVLVTCAVIGLLLFVVLVLGLRTKLQLFRARQSQSDGQLLSDYANHELVCSAVKCGGGSEKLQTKTVTPPIVLVEPGRVPATCVALTVRDTTTGRDTTHRSRRRIENSLTLTDKRHPASPAPAAAAGKPQSVLPVIPTLPKATMSATTVEPANNSSQGPAATTIANASNLASDDKENCLQQLSEEQAQQQQHPQHPGSQRNVLKRQPVAEISLFGPPATPGPTGSPTTFIQLLTPSSASSISTSATTTDNNATPPKGVSAGGGGGGCPLSAAESMAAARFGFSPRSIHSFTVQTATYFRFPDVDDFTPTPRSVRCASKHHDATESSSTPPAVDACTEEESGGGASSERMVVVSSPPLPPVPIPVVKCDLPPPSGVEQLSEPKLIEASKLERKEADAPPDREPRAAHRICAPMAHRRVRLKSISLDSEGARLVEENLTSTIPVQELVGMAQQRSTGRFDEDDNDDEDYEDEDDDHNVVHHGNRNETVVGDNDDDVLFRCSKRAKRVRNILNLRLNIPPLAAVTAPLAPPGASQSTGSMAKATKTMVTVTGSVSNPTMSSTSTTTYPQHQHGMMAVLGGVGGIGGQMDESNEQFYFEYFDYGDEDETDDEDEYDEEEYEEHEDNNNNSMAGNNRMTVAVSLPPAPKTPTLSQSKQKASSLDSDKLRITTTAAVPFGGTGGVGSGVPGGSVSCSGGMSHIMSIAQSTSGHSMSTLSYSNHHQREHQQQQLQQLSQFQQLHQHQQTGQLQQQQPRRVASASVPTTPKRYQYRASANHHHHHHHQQQQQQVQQHYAASGQSKLKPSYHAGATTTTSMPTAGDSGINGNRNDKSPVGHKGFAGGAGTMTLPASQPSAGNGVVSEKTKCGSGDDTKELSSTPAKVPAGGRSSILQRRGSNHSLTLNLDVYNRGGSVDLTSSSCSLYRGSYKNLHQVQSQTQLCQQVPDSGTTVRVQCQQASPKQQQTGALSSGQAGCSSTNNNASGSNSSNVNNNSTSKKNLLQRRGSNTSLTLNLRSGLGTTASGGGGGAGGGGSTFGLNRFSSHNSLNTTHMSALGTINSGAMGGSISGTGISTGGAGGAHHSSSLVRPTGSRKSLLERRNSNASLTLINVNQRTLSVSNCNLRGSICSLNSLLTTHTQNEPTAMMLEEDELDCTGAGNGEGDHHHRHGYHHHHNHGHHHGSHGHRGGEGVLRRFGSSIDTGIHANDGVCGVEGGASNVRAGGESGVNTRVGRSSNYGRLTVATMHGTSMDNSTSSGGVASHQDAGGHGGMVCGARGAGGDLLHAGGAAARQRKFRSSDSLHNINSIREQGLHGCERHQEGHGRMERQHVERTEHLTEAKLMSVGNYQRSCQSSFDDRQHFGSSENFKDHQNKLSIHRGLFQKDPATVTSTSSANNLSALGTGSLCNCCCCCCCCCGPMDGSGACCEENGLITKTGNLSISNSNIRNISTKPLSPQTTSEDFKIYLANIQFLQNASNVLTIAYLRKLHNFFSKTYRQMVADGRGQRRSPQEHQEANSVREVVGGLVGPKMMLLHSDSLHHPPVCEDEAYDEEHKKMVLKIHQEFWDLPTNYQEKPLVFGSQAKNRYKTILPNEHSRVILYPERTVIPAGEPYINANYIKGPDYANNCYIATQGPLPNTIYEFWLMVHQNVLRTANATPALSAHRLPSDGLVQKIVMLTNFVENGRQKCAIYFPQDEGEWLAFGSTADVDVSGVLEVKDTLAAAVDCSERVSAKVRCSSCFFLVHNRSVEQRNGYTVRTLNVVYGARKGNGLFGVTGGVTSSLEHGDDGEEFELVSFRAHHCWFPDWPDHRSPNDINVLLDLSLDVLGANGTDSLTAHDKCAEPDGSFKEDPPETPGSVVERCVSAVSAFGASSVSRTSNPGVLLPIIHCSAGIGRTGCLIAILNGLRQLRLSVKAHRRKQQQNQKPHMSSPTLPDFDGGITEGTALAIAGNAAADRPEVPDAFQEDDDLEQSFPLPPVPVGTGARHNKMNNSVPTAINGRSVGAQSSGTQRCESGQVDILGIVCNLRLQRGGMVQNSEQYELIHRALCLYLEKLTKDGYI